MAEELWLLPLWEEGPRSAFLARAAMPQRAPEENSLSRLPELREEGRLEEPQALPELREEEERPEPQEELPEEPEPQEELLEDPQVLEWLEEEWLEEE